MPRETPTTTWTRVWAVRPDGASLFEYEASVGASIVLVRPVGETSGHTRYSPQGVRGDVRASPADALRKFMAAAARR